jgi:glycosyltransferase involved in cell wall biosynthesis
MINTMFSRMASKRCAAVIVVSPNLLGYLPHSVREFAYVIPPGVDYDIFRPEPQETARASLGIPREGIRILFSDISGSPVKRRDIALSVVEQVQRRLPDTQLLLLSSEPYWRVPLYLNAADCLLLTSEKEGSPNIVKEALATNLPIVSVDVGDVAMRCQDVANCRIVPQDTTSLANAVIDMLAIGRGGGGRAAKRTEIENRCVCEVLHKIYKNICMGTR